MNQVLILLRGIPGSGKSTIARSLVNNGLYDWYEADQYFETALGYVFNQAQLGIAHKECQRKAKMSLLLGNSVIVSNTSTTYKEVKDYLQIAKDMGMTRNQIQIINVYGNFGSVHNVPQNVLDAMKERFEHNINDKVDEYFAL